MWLTGVGELGVAMYGERAHVVFEAGIWKGVVEYSDGGKVVQINCDNFWSTRGRSRAALGEEGRQDTKTRSVRQPWEDQC